jgi:hypothetical protein
MSSPDLSNTRFIAKGAFGAAVKPALPNYNAETGQWIQYPENITKIFYKKNTKNNAVKKQRTAKNMLKSNNLRINEYKYNGYTLKNLPVNIQSRLSSNILPNTPLQLVRLPNLGHDIFDYKQYVETYNTYLINFIKPLLNISFSKSLYEINKLIYNVLLIQSNNYIHGDIKIENIMIKRDGSLTLIDYDVFGTYDEYYNFMSTKHKKPYTDPLAPPPVIEYFGSANNPPESFLFYLLNYIESLIYSNSNLNSITIDTIKSEINNKPEKEKRALLSRIRNYIDYNSKFLSINEELFYDSLLYNLKLFITLYKDNGNQYDIYTFFKYFILNKFDVFGLGVVLYLCYSVYYFYMFYDYNDSITFLQNKINDDNLNKSVNYYYNLLNNIKIDVIDKMLLFQYDKRLSLKEAFIIFKNKFDEYKRNIQQRNNKTVKRSRNNSYKTFGL